MNPTRMDVGVEATYRREQLTAAYAAANSRRHHPVRRVGKAISNLHHRLEVV